MRQRISGLIAPGAILVAAIASLVILSTAAAESPKGRFHSAHTADDRNSLAEKSTFSPETPKVYVAYTLNDVMPGARVKIVWTAEKVEGVVENSKIDQAETTTTTMISGLFSYSKPPKGWPAGTYRVDLFIDGRLDKTIRFKVVK